MNTEPAVVLPWHGRETSERRIADADWERLERHAAEILAAFGMDLDTPGTRETPARFLRALYDATAGYDGDPKLLTSFPAEHAGTQSGLILEGPISFHALCEHHALPFHGAAHVAYVAGEEIIGISKLTRIVRLYARRFTVQERMGEQIADALTQWIEATDVDGFNLAYAVTPESFEDFVELVVPELQRRGVYKLDYRAGTLREKLFGPGRARLTAPHPAARYRASARSAR